MEKKLTKNEKGITLVALIITIIILLILAIVSIRAIKDGGILSKTQSAKEIYSEAEEKEKIKLAINQAAIDGIGTIKESYLTPALNEQFGENNWEYTQKKEGEYLVVKIKASQRKYVINVDGTVDIPEDIIVEGEDMFEYSDDNTTVTGLSAAGRKKIGQQVKKGSEIKLTIPATHNEIPITGIKKMAFYSCKSITNVTIGENVTSIGEDAFFYCTSLTNVTIPNSVTSIGKQAFSYCTSLTNVTIPNNMKSIEEYTFYNCTNLTNVAIGRNVISIGYHAFSDCTSLENVIIPDSVTSISKYAFTSCLSLTYVKIGKNVSNIGEMAFHKCTSLTNVTIPNSVISIENGVFRDCISLADVTIQNKNIGEGEFYNCTSLTNVTIPNSVTSIGIQAYYGCGFEKIEIPQSVTTITGGRIFSNCKNLTDIYCPGNASKPDGWDEYWSGCYSAEVHWGESMPK